MTLWWGLWAAGAAAALPLDPGSSPVALEQSMAPFDFGISTGEALGAADSGVDFGIPASAPWMDPTLDQEKAAAAREESLRRRHPLETRFWERIEEDLISLEIWRLGMLDAARYARGTPQIFPPAPIERTALFVEYEEAARAAWRRASDYLLAVDSILARYAEFPDLEGRAEKKAAFALAFAAAAAQTRFAREWAPYGEHDAALLKIFNEEIAPLGIPAGSWDRLARSRLSPEWARAFSSSRAYYRSIGGSAVLAKTLGTRRREWARNRSQDLKAAPKAAARAKGRPASLPPVYRTRAQTIPFDEAVQAEIFKRKPLLPPLKNGPAVTVSSQVIYGIEALRYWLAMDPPQGSRPALLIDSRGIELVRRALLPGDILLARRERHLVSVGAGGYWQTAGVYVGEEKIAAASRGGVAFESVERFCAADSLAVLRTRLAPDARAEAVKRALSLSGAGFDPWEDPGSADLIGRAELLSRVFSDALPGLNPAQSAAGRRAFSVNGLARRFDAAYGTRDAVLDFVLFIDGDEARHNARAATVEEFRSSWRRPKWTLAQENDR